MKNKYKNNNQGRTMLETILYLSLISMVSITLIGAVNGAMGKYKISKFVQQIHTVKKNITARYLADGSYAKISNANLKKDKVIPSDMTTDDGFVHAFSGKMEVTGTSASYTIALMGLSKTACLEISVIDWRVDDTTPLLSVGIASSSGGATKKYAWEKNKSDNTLPLTLTEAAKSCTGTANKVELTFE
ncbi:MAG: type 4 pilus major pilin [Alphaproteobacteria bacterium]|nr:type 4 pilus major pilin [Alphaproteobacteria bacterium]